MPSKPDPSPSPVPSSSAASTSTITPAMNPNAPRSPPRIASPTQPTPETTPPDAEASGTPAPSYFPDGRPKSRTPRPQGVVMPSPPMYRGPGSASSDRPGSPIVPNVSGGSGGGLGKASTPTGSDKGYSPTFSPVASGPLSPGSSQIGSNSFIFPIRSVFQGMNPVESTSPANSDGGAALGRVNTRPGSGHGRSPSRTEDGRWSRGSSVGDNDAGIATIQQLLQGGGQKVPTAARPARKQTGVAMFSGKAGPDRHASSSGTRPARDGSLSSTQTSPATEPPRGFFSMPLLNNGKEADESPFFQNPRRSSDGVDVDPAVENRPQEHAQAEPARPEMPKEDSASTVRGESGSEEAPKNASADAGGSGLPEKGRAPVGQPQQAPAGVNFRDRPGDKNFSAESASYSAPGQGESSAALSSEAPATANPKSTTEIKQPKPKPVGSQGFDGLNESSRKSNRSYPDLETDEQGMQAIVNNFSGIVRLGEAGSLSSNAATGPGTGGGSGSGGRSSHRGKGAPSSNAMSSGPSATRLAQQQRANKNIMVQDSVQKFVNAQANTVNLSDPNAPTPSPGPGSQQMQDARIRAEQDRDATREEMDGTPPARGGHEERGGRDSAVSDNRDWPENSDTSMSVRESSEMATASASGEDGAADDEAEEESEEEEPIVTFRFEHVATEDGHHVVVGREGRLSKCEDEPITTPGAVQGFGVLMVLEEDFDSGRMAVRQVSENSTELLGLSPRYLFRLDCFTRILTLEQEDILRDNVEYLPDAESATGKNSVAEEGPQVFLLSGFGEPGSDDADEDETTSSAGGRRREWTCWVAAHRPKQPTWDKVDAKGRPIQPPDLIVLEFELERDVYNPLMQTFEPALLSSGGDTPETGSQTTLSVGSGGHGGSANSGDVSAGSLTTVGTTPRPGTATGAESNSDGSTAITSRPPTSSQPSFSSRPSSKLPRGKEPMGLEGIEVEVPLERIIESTTNHARPLRALERMRRTGAHGDSSAGTDSGSGSRGGRSARRQARRVPPGGGSTGTMDVFAVLGQINDQLGSAPDLETFLKITVGVVQDLCRFHRVLIYQFDEAYNGQVVAELVEWGKTTDLYKGLMFPAADIPAQARQLYMTNKVRLLYDRSQTTARMVLRDREDLDHPLDMTHCYLRAMSPIHIKYLANMHVRSSMSVSIMAFGQLWGLIACHSYGHHGMRVSFPVRQMMRILSDSISRNIERLSYAQRLHTRKLISTIPTQHHPTGYIVSNADDLLQIFDADAGLLVIGDGCKLLGQNEQGQAMLAIAEYLRIMKFENMKSSNYLQKDFPDLVLPRAQDTIAGLLYVPLTAKAGQDFIVFLRKGQVREVQWAGKPYKDERAGEQASLEPRKSFKMWSEVVTGRSRAWTDDQLESAGVLALIYGKFIQVWREKQSAMASNQLTAILLSNTSHAVRTPLSQIINTLELALAGNIDADTRSMLENSHQASRALLFHVHDLLDLTRIETGNETAFSDPFDIRQSISDAVRLYQTESARRGLDFRVNMSPDLPHFVIGDSRKIKTVISNLVANSVKFTESGFIEVYCGLQNNANSTEIERTGYIPIEIVISDSGCGIPTDKLEAMFVTLEGADEQKSESTGLGLGLAVVARIVEQLAGQLRAESEVGVGTRFFFTLNMLTNEQILGQDRVMPADSSSQDHHIWSEPSRKSSSNKSAIATRPRTASSDGKSVVSLRSAASQSDSLLSEIDNFVQDFGSSHMLAPVAADDKRLRDAEERMNKPGTFPVTDSSWPVRPSKVDTDTDVSSTSTSPRISSVPSAQGSAPHAPNPTSPRPSGPSRTLSYRQQQLNAPGVGNTLASAVAIAKASTGGASKAPPTTASAEATAPSPQRPMKSSSSPSGKQVLRVLVVEDDAINSQILQKRLRMDKHTVVAVGNGQEAVDMLRNDWHVDAVLMDIQMPIMDGRTAAKEVRKLEAKLEPRDDVSSLRIDGRIPIFAVSASLYESDRLNLAQDFDGWLLKPLDFARVRALLAALQDPQRRSDEVYVQGHWERGGYLRDAPRSLSRSGTTTSAASSPAHE